MKEIGQEISRSWDCLWSIHDACSVVAWRLWLFAFAATLNFVAKISTIGYVQGPIYFGLIYCIPIPIGNLFWMLFSDEGGHLLWNPHFDTKCLFAILGLCLIIPATGIFYFLGIREKTEKIPEK